MTRVPTLAGLAAVLLAAAVAPGAAAASPAALLRDVEERFRGQPRVVRLDVATTRPQAAVTAGEPAREEVGLWGVVGGDAGRTELLFVFTAPRRARGTGLLLEDARGAEDAMWYHMRTFDRFKRIPRSSLKLRVLGTCLTYEDAHGFFSSDKYEFSPGGAAAASGEEAVRAVPRTPELARDLGFAAAELTVDRDRRLVTGVRLLGAGDHPLRTYRVADAVRVGTVWLPRYARVADLASGVVSEIAYGYWPLPAPPAAELFSVHVAGEPLLDRLLAALAALGVPAAAEGAASGGRR